MPANLPRISIAMCTYNAGRFVLEQLTSLARQTLLPCELIVSDDASTDDTVAVVNRFADSAPFPVRVVRQEKNLGWRLNREQSFTHCTGDWVAACDGDDVWHADKLAKMADAAAALPGCRIVCCDTEVVDQQLNPQGHTAWQVNGLDSARQHRIQSGDALGALLAHSPIGDACILIRKDLLQLSLPLPPDWATDAWVVSVAAATGPFALVSEPLQVYRQHAANLSGAKRKTMWTRYTEARNAVSEQTFARQEREYAALLDRVTGIAPPAALTLIEQRLKFASIRRQMRLHPWKRPWLVTREWLAGNYQIYGSGWRSVALDLLV